ncbi:MAG: flagellar basal body P-ring protein FlgI, partial [Armatimonadota bacterium]
MPMEVRVKDLAELNTGGAHKLIGYGLVVGLQGTGDGKDAAFTIQALANMLSEFGVTVQSSQLDVENVAAVIATAELPGDIPVGATVDVTVSSLGDADSLEGGTLLLTPLTAADRQVYVVAQGSVSIGGYSAGTANAQARKNHTAVGLVPNGGSVVRPVSSGLQGARCLILGLHQPDYTTAHRLAQTINADLDNCRAHAVSAAMVEVAIDQAPDDLMALITRIQTLPVEPDVPARVVINERTGTVVMGSHVRILPVAVAHGNLTVRVRREHRVSQPPPLVSEHDNTVIVTGEAAPADKQKEPADTGDGAEETSSETEAAEQKPEPKHRTGVTGGKTVVVPDDRVEVQEEDRRLSRVGGETSLQDLVEGLNALGVTPRDLIAIIEALKEAGALQADLVIQ